MTQPRTDLNIGSSTELSNRSNEGSSATSASIGGTNDIGLKPNVEGSLASFICHVAYLENQLRDDTGTVFFDQNLEITGRREKIGNGAQFGVEKAEWSCKPGQQIDQTRRWGKWVALKTVKPKDYQTNTANDWTEILLEIRTLMHSYLRYHPNIVRLLGFGWGPSVDSNAVYPILVLEHASHGSLAALQASVPPLRFAVKQKLCHDVARGLAILHACGIVHGDVKHENILVFDNRYNQPPAQPYTAKLADFGAADMDITEQGSHQLRMKTFPYEAPEISSTLTPGSLKKTDVYSFGLLVWRTFIDGKGLLAELGFSNLLPAQVQILMKQLKLNDGLLVEAVDSVRRHIGTGPQVHKGFVMVVYTLIACVTPDAKLRELPKAQAALRGMDLGAIGDFMVRIESANLKDLQNEQGRAPGSHGISADSLGFQLGKLGDDYDAQQNLPGLRPDLPQPERAEFLFEPWKLKKLLEWPQQVRIVKELEVAARSKSCNTSVTIQPFKAAYYLFQCYLVEFGVRFNAKVACEWLLVCSEDDDDADVNYYAQAWVWRVGEALGFPAPFSQEKLLELLKLSALRGHRHCFEDAKYISQKLVQPDDRAIWNKEMQQAKDFFHTIAGGTGMPHQLPRNLRRAFDLDNIQTLDDQIRMELGSNYESCLRKNQADEAQNPEATAFDSIYVTRVGHGLLHYAATMGKVNALKHMIKTYVCNINLENQLQYETPLVCACRSGQFDCAAFLIEAGARAVASDIGEEAPLHWLGAIADGEIEPLARMLVAAGADLEQPSGIGRRSMNADWEQLFQVSVTPLGRAVLMKSLPAVRILLKLGADPLLKKNLKKSSIGQSAAELAAILTLPEILEVLLLHLDEKLGFQQHIFDEIGMLAAAHRTEIIPFDSLSLQSRLVRCGPLYRSALIQTMTTLQERRVSLHPQKLGAAGSNGARQLCAEITLGNESIVEALLALGHDANGTIESKPLYSAVSTNHEGIFQLLVSYGADVHSPGIGAGRTLLQMLASRPRTSRSGTWIAEYLIRAGVPVETAHDESASAFVLAVENHYFDLADLLLSKGASMNALYRPKFAEPRVTILSTLIAAQSQRSLKSIEYLFDRGSGNDSSQTQYLTDSINAPFEPADASRTLAALMTRLKMPSQELDVLAEHDTGLNVLHSLSFHAHQSHVSELIIHKIFSLFGKPEHINYIHAVVGTPLCLAALMGNSPMLNCLLDRDANLAHTARPDLCFHAYHQKLSLSHPPKRGEPIWLALCLLNSRVDMPGEIPPDQNSSNFEDVVRDRLLPLYDGVEVRKAWEAYQERKASRKRESRRQSDAAAPATSHGDSEPIDLSVLSEEKPSGWTDGCDMTSEMACRIFLRSFRNGGF